MDFFINTAQAQAAGAGGGQGIMSALMLPLVLLVVFYFLLIRPQNKRAKEQREMLSKVSVGDEVATTGGILGKVTEVGEQFLTLEIASGVNVKLQKFQVSQVLPKGSVKNA
jgi:preprotein translocase subunit YajC